MSIRPASVRDVVCLYDLINNTAEYGLMLHRSMAYLYEHVRDFRVATSGASGASGGDGGPAEAGEKIVGVCGLNIIWSNLAEVYSLVVEPARRGRGIGKQLVLDCVDEAKRLGIHKLMTLTYEVPFFEACGFATTDRQQLPLKVWSECLRCSRNQACDEVAMIRVFDDVPECAAPRPSLPPEGTYEVPVPLGIEPALADRRPKMDTPR